MSDNGKFPKLIFKAELVRLPDGKLDIQFTIGNNHIPTLDTVSNQLLYEIMELRAIAKTQVELKNAKKVKIHPAGGDDLVSFLRRQK